jgi:hypothetical protein
MQHSKPLEFATSNSKRKIAEKWNLLSGVEKEYNQAKLKAARALGVHLLPTNLEAAIKLDRSAQNWRQCLQKTRQSDLSPFGPAAIRFVVKMNDVGPPRQHPRSRLSELKFATI